MLQYEDYKEHPVSNGTNRMTLTTHKTSNTNRRVSRAFLKKCFIASYI